MIPPSLPGAADPAVSIQDSPSSEFSGVVTGVADSFSSFISQALDSYQANSAVLNQRPQAQPPSTDGAGDLPFDTANSNYLSPSGADSSQSTSPTDSSDEDPSKDSSHKQSGGAMDPAVQNSIAMLLAGILVPTTKPEHLVPTPTVKQAGANSSNVQALNSEADSRSSAATAHDAQAVSSSVAAALTGKAMAIADSNIAEKLKPFNESASAAKDSSTNPPTSPTPAQTASDATKASSQAALLQAIASTEKEGNPATTPSGTTAALNAGTMKSTGQKTENAGRTVQKLPSASATGNSSTGSNVPGAPIGTTGSGRKSDWGSFSSENFDLAIPMATGELHDPAAAAAPAADSAAAQAERVANFVAQEAMTIRLSGATSLAVSLKLDHQTELFVQLTNHAGQIQASLRCERGSLAGLEGHWSQLQESLARQNVELLPPDNRSFSQNQFANHSHTSGTGDSEQGTQRQRQQDSAASAPATADKPAAATKSSKSRKNSRGKGWESWA